MPRRAALLHEPARQPGPHDWFDVRQKKVEELAVDTGHEHDVHHVHRIQGGDEKGCGQCGEVEPSVVPAPVHAVVGWAPGRRLPPREGPQDPRQVHHRRHVQCRDGVEPRHGDPPPPSCPLSCQEGCHNCGRSQCAVFICRDMRDGGDRLVESAGLLVGDARPGREQELVGGQFGDVALDGVGGIQRWTRRGFCRRSVGASSPDARSSRGDASITTTSARRARSLIPSLCSGEATCRSTNLLPRAARICSGVVRRASASARTTSPPKSAMCIEARPPASVVVRSRRRRPSNGRIAGAASWIFRDMPPLIIAPRPVVMTRQDRRVRIGRLRGTLDKAGSSEDADGAREAFDAGRTGRGARWMGNSSSSRSKTASPR